MEVRRADIPDVLLLEPRVFEDARGFFLERWNDRVFRETTGLDVRFVQENHSRSLRGVLRGLHYQVDRPQGKLVWAARGRVFDVVVDLRRSSPTFRQVSCRELSDENHVQAWIPPGFAHGFLVLSESADFVYKTTDYYFAPGERTIAWNDPELAIPWPAIPGGAPILSAKDVAGLRLADAPTFS